MEKQNDVLKKCEICASYATILCNDCMSYYCDSCAKFIHTKDNNSNHKNEPIDPFVPIDTKCSTHARNPLDLFCLEEKGIHIFLFIYNNII